MQRNSSPATKKNNLPKGAQIAIVVIIFISVFLCFVILSGDTEPAPDSGNQQTSSAPSTSTSTQPLEQVLVDNETMKAAYMGAQDGSELGVSGVFYVTIKIENFTDSDILISLEDADVDNETVSMVGTGVPLVIRPGNSGQTSFIFPMSQLSISTMDEAENATFRIVARDNDTLDTVFESELVTIDLH